MALSDLPVPKKGALTQIGQHKKRKVLWETLFLSGKFLKNKDKTKITCHSFHATRVHIVAKCVTLNLGISVSSY
jgi:hypothetical protein